LATCARQAGFTSVEVTTSAANADGFFGISFGFQQVKIDAGKPYQMKSQIRLIRAVHSWWLQCQEALELRKNPHCGEEAVLICQK
jgi:hypothetical protein